MTLLLLFALDPAGLTAIDAAVEKAIKDGQAPGAVVVVLHRGEVVYRKAFGVRVKGEPMTADTVFDLASLTKPVATAASVMKLIDAGKLRLDDPVSKHVPGFKDGITLEHLLLHTSGLPAGSATKNFEAGREEAVKHLVALSPKAEPGKKFVYSDLGFILLGFVVEKASGEALDAFSTKEVFAALGMKDTGFRPAKGLHGRVAPTEKGLRGEVHDPRARAMGGVAGHAGLFGTADDLTAFAKALLSGKVLTAATTELYTTPRGVPGGKRTPGWDARTSYSSNRGSLFGGFGHTGFTGTSLWIDPPSATAVVVLTSRLQDEKGNVTRLRAEVATLAAKAVLAK
ncbi:MAG: serine hydrolase domain-containing protein [Gemmataceae bacterium]